jgi:ABC-type Fe3+-hydroxamate transport system substrate-binding protein
MGTLQTTDQLGRPLELMAPPRRIVSLVPSQTELLAYLGLEQSVVGITKFCTAPAAWRNTRKIVGGTKRVRIADVLALQPDLVLANKEENTKEDIAALAERVPVWVSDVNTLADATAMITSVGVMTHTQPLAAALVTKINDRFVAMAQITTARTLYLIWMDPWMGAASGTFIDAMMRHLGLKNVLAQASRYPQLTEAMIRELDPELILLSSEPYPFDARHAAQIQSWMPDARILLLDGTYFSWYGSRLAEAPLYFSSIFTPSALRSDQNVG